MPLSEDGLKTKLVCYRKELSL